MKAIVTEDDPLTSLQVNDYFASYFEETPLFYKFKVNFSILQSEIVKKSFSKLRIEIYSENAVVDPISNAQYASPAQGISSDPAPMSNLQIIQDLLKQNYKQKSAVQKKNQTFIGETILDLFTFVNPAAIPLLKAGILPEQIPALFAEVDTLAISDLEFDPIQNAIPEASVNPRELMMDLITKFKIDPSEVVNISNDPHGLVTKLKNYYLNDAAKSLPKDTKYYRNVRKVKLVDRVHLSRILNIPKNFSNENLKLYFKIMKSGSNVSSTKAIKELNVPYLLNLSSQNLLAPEVNFQANQFAITQKSKVDNSIRVLKKSMNDSGHFNSYSDETQLSVPTNKQGFVSGIKKFNKLDFYRFKSFSLPSTVESPVYRNIVIGELSKIDETGLIVIDDPLQDGVLLKVEGLSTDVLEIKISRRQRVNDDAFGPSTDVVPYTRVTARSLNTNDTTVQSDQIYEYTVYQKTSGGTVRKSVSQLHRYVRSAIFSNITTKISDQSITSYNNSPSFSFSIETSLKPDVLNKIKQILTSQGILEEFQNDLTNVQQQFKQALYHKVIRVNLRTGMRETFDDIVTSGVGGGNFVNFIDNSLNQQNYSITPIDSNTSYMYEVRTFIRDPSSLLKEIFVKNVTKLESFQKQYFYKPYKWRQPFTLKNGTLFPFTDSGELNGSKPIFEDGEVGTTATVTLPAFSTSASVFNVKGERLDAKKLKISWDLQQLPSKYDHFLVVKEIDRKREIVAAVCTKEMLYTLKKSDTGTIIFYVVPVLNDFTVVSAVRISQSIVIDPEEMIGLDLE